MLLSNLYATNDNMSLVGSTVQLNVRLGTITKGYERTFLSIFVFII